MSGFPGHFARVCQTAPPHLGVSPFCAIEARDGDERNEGTGSQGRGK